FNDSKKYLRNTQEMKNQFKDLGISFDWNHEISTCSPSYCKWTQWLFLKLFENKLAYKQYAPVHWDPIDKTVLADEQVDEITGKSWRSGCKVETKLMNQWFIRTRTMSHRLTKSLLDGKIGNQNDQMVRIQKNWLGICSGYSLDFTIDPFTLDDQKNVLKVACFVDKFETLFSCSDIIVSDLTLIAKHRDLKEKLLNSLLLARNPVTGFEHKMKYMSTRDISSTFSNEFKDARVPFISPLRNHEINLDSKRKKVIHDYFKDCGVQPIPFERLPIMPSDPDYDSCPKCFKTAVRDQETLDTFFDSSWYYLRFLDPHNDKNIAEKDKGRPVDLYVGGVEHAKMHLYYARFMAYFMKDVGIIDFEEPFKKILLLGVIMGKTYLETKSGKYLSCSEVEKSDLGSFKSVHSGESVLESWQKMSKSKKNGLSPIKLLNDSSKDYVKMYMLSSSSPKLDRKWTTDHFKGIHTFGNKFYATMIKYGEKYSSTSSKVCHYSKDVNDFEQKISKKIDQLCAIAHHHMEHTYQTNTLIINLQSALNHTKSIIDLVDIISETIQKYLLLQINLYSIFAPHLAMEIKLLLQERYSLFSQIDD
ncbi:MAG: class-I aminoacyl-tRNA synthetase, partial [Paramarteilia canceri]